MCPSAKIVESYGNEAQCGSFPILLLFGNIAELGKEYYHPAIMRNSSDTRSVKWDLCVYCFLYFSIIS